MKPLWPYLPIFCSLSAVAQYTTDHVVDEWVNAPTERVTVLRTFDVGGDGDQDVFMIRNEQSIHGVFQWYRNEGMGVFTGPIVLHEAFQGFPDVPRDFDLADADQDGDLDVAFCTDLSDDIQLCLFDGFQFGPPALWGAGFSYPKFVRWMQLNPLDDNLPDLVAHGGNPQCAGLINLGGSFAPWTIIGDPLGMLGPDGMEVGNITGNLGDVVVFGNSQLWFHSLVNTNGNLSWSTTSQAYNVGEFQVIDIDGDGDDDIGRLGADSVVWLPSSGSITGGLGYELIAPGTGGSGVFGRVDCDFPTDVIHSPYGSTMPPTIQLGQTTGGFAFSGPTAMTGTANGLRFLRLADLDEDGQNDLIAVVNGHSLHWYTNEAPGQPVLSIDAVTDTLLWTCPESVIPLPQATPAGGTYTGAGVVNGEFHPYNLQASSDITYTYTDANGCTSVAHTVIPVDGGVSISPFPNGFSQCVNSFPVQLSSQPAGAIWTGAAVTPTGYVDMALPFTGLLAYLFTDIAGCASGGQIPVQIKPYLYGTVTIPEGRDTVCTNEGIFPVYYSDGQGGMNLVLFDPAVLSPGTYTYLGYPNSGGGSYCYAAASDSVVLVAAPGVSLDIPADSILVQDGAYQLAGGDPAGGLYTGGLGVDGGVLDPSLSGLGWQPITYTYSDGTCTVSSLDSVYVSTGVNTDGTQRPRGLFAWPIPSTGTLHITRNEDALGDEVELLDANGRSVLRKRIADPKAGHPFTLDLSDIANGCYTLMSSGDKAIMPLRVIVAR